MRATCDSCETRQPSDWKPGDLCTSCGEVARRERRCHWCVKYTPEGRFCRSCGGETVTDELYAPARMLKAAGVDQFSIAAKLADLDGDHVQHLTRMYQKQATVVGRHVDDLRFVEQHLIGGGWSDALDDDLTAQLPMDEGSLEPLNTAVPKTIIDDPADRMRALILSTPFRLTSVLAAVAVIRNGWLTHGDQADLAEQALGSDDLQLNDEAALAFGHWRTLHLPMRLVTDYKVIDALSTCTRKADAAIALRLLGQDDEVDTALLASSDPDQAFGAALALGAIEPLRAALQDPQRRYAAARSLARNNHEAFLANALTEIDNEDQLESLIGLLYSKKRAMPELRDALWQLATEKKRLRTYALGVIVHEQRGEDASRMINLDPTDTSMVQSVLQKMGLNETDLTEISRQLVRHKRFRTSQYGVSDLAKNGTLRDDFIPSVWSLADDDEQRIELLRFVREQLSARGNEGLMKFAIHLVFGDYDFEVRSQAWNALPRESHRNSDQPLLINEESINRLFGTVPEFLDRFAALLGDPRLGDYVLLFDPVEQILHYSPTDQLGSVTVHEDAFERFFVFLAAFLRTNARQGLRVSSVGFLEHVGQADPAWIDRVIALFQEFEGTDLEFECQTAANRLEDKWWLRQ
jgi:hypothetical protein